MAFSATPAFVGTPDFGLIHIDPVETARAFQTYIDTASRLTGVSLDDITRTIIEPIPDGTTPTLVDLLTRGMKLFDAIVWLTAGRPASHPLSVDPAMRRESIASLHDVARAVFFCYFMLVVQARYPTSSNVPEAARPVIPNFLRTIMGMDQPQHVYVERICTFEPQKFDASWARHVRFDNFGQEVLSRFGLGVAGYRMFGPFSLYAPRPDLPENLTRAFSFARTMATSPASWDIHPLTRNPNVLTRRGNLNKNLGNLMLDVFTREQLEEMRVSRMIYAIPERQAQHRQYLQWEPADDISGTARIFN